MRFTILPSALLSLLAPSIVSAACYAPNGVLEPNTAYQPCINIEGIHSMCCALNRTIVGGVADRCQQNGLCISGDGASWRGFCTDKNWDSPGCLSNTICNSATGGTSSNSNELTKCQDGTYCCNGGNTTCCSQGKGFTLNPTLIKIQTATSSTSSSTSSTTSNTPLSTPTESSSCLTSNTTDNDIKSDAINHGTSATTIGIGVGVPLALLAVAGTALGFWLGQKRGRRTHTALSDKDEQVTPNEGGGYAAVGGENVKPGGNFIDGYYAPSLRERLGPGELRGTEAAVELNGDGRRG